MKGKSTNIDANIAFLTPNSKKETATPVAAPDPARPMKCPDPMQLENKEAPT